MGKFKESEISWIQIDNNLRVSKVKGKVRVIENEERRIYLDKKRAKEIKTFMLDIFKTGQIEE